nr:protein zyg 11 B [Hymenolepis microstoma]
MGVSPLTSLCVRFIVNNFDTFTTLCSDCAEPRWVWRFPYSDCHIPSPVADMILKEASEHKLLKAEHLTLFSKQNVCLYSFILRNIDLTPSSISILQDFKLSNLVLDSVNGINLEDLSKNFNEGIFENLHTLNLRNFFINEESVFTTISALAKFRNLQFLNIGGTDLDSTCLNILAKNLTDLKYLDISETCVGDISCLGELTNLVGLIMHLLPFDEFENFETTLTVLLKLKKLRILDISQHGLHSTSRSRAVDIFVESSTLPCLKCFHLSGNPYGFTVADISKFVENHPTLEVLGLIGCFGLFPMLNAPTKYNNLVILGGGEEGEERAIKTINWSTNRPCCLDFAFLEVSSGMGGLVHYTYKTIDAVVSAIEKHDFPEIAIATGLGVIRCILEEESVSGISGDLLSRVYKCALMGMEKVIDVDDIPGLLTEILLDGRIGVDHKLCFDIGIRCLGIYSVPETVAEALCLSLHCIHLLSAAQVHEAASNPLYIMRLIKCAAELYLDKAEADVLIAEFGDEKMPYLRNFVGISTNGVMWGNLLLSDGDVIEILRRLLDVGPSACSHFITFGGIEVLTKILNVTRMIPDWTNLENRLFEVLRMAGSYLLDRPSDTVSF